MSEKTRDNLTDEQAKALAATPQELELKTTVTLTVDGCTAYLYRADEHGPEDTRGRWRASVNGPHGHIWDVDVEATTDVDAAAFMSRLFLAARESAP